ncbi:yip1d-interacting factor 1 [Brevipalpus obovatus]|uniref:yip1d-interacting factor 1 n=1 Tax=Brevipalpus obovatus TaxID=246614 RepID=UPI003D9E3D7E
MNRDQYPNNQGGYGQVPPPPPPGPQQMMGGQGNYVTPTGYPVDYYASPFMNQQIGNQMAQIFQDQVAQYSDNIVTKGKSWVGNNLKHYFAVDTPYVLKKLLLLFFPFSHKDWSRKYRDDQSVPPREDLNAPDLYIPMMAFVTYLLVSGYLLGVSGQFSPEKLGIQASSALVWLVLEVVITMIVLYTLNIAKAIGLLNVVALSGYKYVPMITAMLTAMVFGRYGYYIALGYGCFSLFIFLLRTLHRAVESSTSSHPGSQNIFKLIFYCVAQPLPMFYLTSQFV